MFINIHHLVILGTPFINLITPFSVKYDKISSKAQNGRLNFPFLEKSKSRNLNIIKASSIYTSKMNALIKQKQNDVLHLK